MESWKYLIILDSTGLKYLKFRNLETRVLLYAIKTLWRTFLIAFAIMNTIIISQSMHFFTIR